ncbi:MAG: histidine kinase N-terminal 7TM domain-containing protein [Anaerolineaceae bacterium]
MIYHFLPVDLLFFGAAIISLFVAIIIFIKRVEPGGTAFALVMLAIVLWLIFRVFEGLSEGITEKIFWAKFEYLGIATLPVCYFIFASQFSRRDRWITKKNLFIAFLLPLLTLILVFTNEYHGLIWSNIYPSTTPDVDNLVYVHGYFYWVYWIFSYSMLLWGIYRLITTFLNFSKEYRFQVFLLIFATLVPWVGNLLYILHLSPIQGMDLTPVGLAFSGLIIAISLYRGQIFEVAPVARNIIFDVMQEGILVLDTNGNIVDGNAAAEEILEISLRQLLKKHFVKSLLKYPKLIENLQKMNSSRFEMCLNEVDQKYVQVSHSLIVTNVNPTGQLIVLQDISKRKKLEHYENEQRKYAEALARIVATLNSSLDLDVVLEKMLDIIHEVVPHDAANIALLDENAHMHFVKLKGYENFNSKNIIESLNYTIDDIPDFKKMAEGKEAVVVADTQNNPRWVENPEVKWIRSYVGSPIVVEGKTIGFINVDSSIPNFYTSEHAQRLKVFADEAAIAIQNARIVEELKERNRDLTTLYEVGVAMTKGLDDQEIVSGLTKQIENFKEIDIFFLAMFNDEPGKASFYIYNSDKKSLQRVELSIPLDVDFINQIKEQKSTIYLPDNAGSDIMIGIPEKDSFLFETMRSYLGIPLVQGNEVIGVLSVISKNEDAFNQKQIRLLETVASQVSITLQNVKMYERMKELAIIDELTGIYNRRFFYLAANKEIERAIRYSKNLSLILIDIDHYKDVNDHFGHMAGDKVLQKLTQVIQKELRSSDVFSRYGGEEFLILLSDTDGDAAAFVAERIRTKVENFHVKYNEEEISVTVSLGVTQITAERNTLQELIAIVDQALYGAKQKGRNRVEFIA